MAQVFNYNEYFTSLNKWAKHFEFSFYCMPVWQLRKVEMQRSFDSGKIQQIGLELLPVIQKHLNEVFLKWKAWMDTPLSKWS